MQKKSICFGLVCFHLLVLEGWESSCYHSINETDGEWNIANPHPRGITVECSDGWHACDTGEVCFHMWQVEAFSWTV